ncbi:MAG: glycosyltransferase family 9 protein [Parachlamydiales bacterium]|nr:glycosyltransferase family 9 protein [Parachlamydiales bacterium]
MKKRAGVLLHFFDRNIGVPLVFFLGIFKKKRILKDVKKIAVLNTAAIGDTILISAIIKDLKAHYPEAYITFFSGPDNFQAASLCENVRCVKLPITQILKTFILVRKCSFDLWIDCGQWPRINALISFFSKSKFTIGFETNNQYRHYLYDQSVKHLENVHELENFRNLIRCITVPALHIPQFKIREENSKNQTHSEPIVVHLFAGGSQAIMKHWDPKKWAEVIDSITLNGNVVHFTGSQKDYYECQSVLDLCQRKDKLLNQAGKLSLKDTAQLLNAAEAVISVDTGIVHLAAALNCAVVAIHGPTSPERWGAIGNSVVFVTPRIKYKPCISMGFEKICAKNMCMKSIQSEDVINALERAIKLSRIQKYGPIR